MFAVNLWCPELYVHSRKKILNYVQLIGTQYTRASTRIEIIRNGKIKESVSKDI
jgi:hypothetical protein